MPSLFKYGVKRLQVVMIDDDGYPIGLEADGTIPDPNAPDLATAYHSLMMTGYVSSKPASREVKTATDEADGKNWGDIDTGVSSYGAVELTLSQRNAVFFEMIRNVTPNSTWSSGMRMSSKNNTRITPKYMGLIITDQVRDEETGELLFEHQVYNKGTFQVTAEAGGNQSAGTNPSPLTVTFKPLPTTRQILTAALYSALSLNVDEDMDTDSPITSPYEFAITTFIKDGIATTFNTKYKPTVTGATVGGINSYTSEGAHAALTSLTTAGLATMSAVGTSGHRAVLAYANAFKAA